MSKTSKNNKKQSTKYARDYAREDTKIDLDAQKKVTKSNIHTYIGKNGGVYLKKPSKSEIRNNVESSHLNYSTEGITMSETKHQARNKKTGEVHTITMRPNNEGKNKSSNTNTRQNTGKNKDRETVMNGSRTRDELRGVKPEGKGEKALSQGYTTTAAKKKADSKARRDYNKKRRYK